MAKETVSYALTNGDANNPIQASVVQSVDDPSKNGVVVLAPDGSTISGGGGGGGTTNDKGFFFTLTYLQTKYPTGALGNVANVNGELYSWNGTAWTDTGYKATTSVDNEGSDPEIVENAIVGMSLSLQNVNSANQLIVSQPTAANFNANVSQATASNLNATVAIAAAQTLATVTTLGNQSNIGGIPANLLFHPISDVAYNIVANNYSFT